MDLQVVLNTYGSDVFRKQADQDYIAARMSYRLQLRQQFLWLALQAVEKYLKGVLLFNGLSARYKPDSKQEFKHDIEALLDRTRDVSFIDFQLSDESRRFLRILNDVGSAPNRYLSNTSYNLPEFIHNLDESVWKVLHSGSRAWNAARSARLEERVRTIVTKCRSKTIRSFRGRARANT